MSYCTECGTHYGDGVPVCPSCGQNIVMQDHNLETEETPAVKTLGLETELTANTQLNDDKVESTEIARLEALLAQYNNKPETSPEVKAIEAFSVSKDYIPEATGDLVADTGSNINYFQADGQLGKGIIKPQKIELATDGVHFKYDTPSHTFIQAEPIKEKPREYRVTSSDMEPNTVEDVYIAKEPVLEQVVPPIPEANNLVAEVIPAQEEEDLSNVVVNDDIPLMTEPETILEPLTMEEEVEEPNLPEPELKETYEAEVIWEARQTWFKIPLGNVYRVTGRSLIILGKYHHKLLEVSVSLITEVTLRQSGFAKLFGIGDLLISIPDFSAPKVVLRGIPQPARVKLMLENLCPDKV